MSIGRMQMVGPGMEVISRAELNTLRAQAKELAQRKAAEGGKPSRVEAALDKVDDILTPVRGPVPEVPSE